MERTQGFQWNQDTFSPSSYDDDDKKESIVRYTDQQSSRLEYHVVPQVRMANIFYFRNQNLKHFFSEVFSVNADFILKIVFRFDLTFF